MKQHRLPPHFSEFLRLSKLHDYRSDSNCDQQRIIMNFYSSGRTEFRKCNEAQPVRPRCGDADSCEDPPQRRRESMLSATRRRGQLQTDIPDRAMAELQFNQLKADAGGIRLRPELRNVCIRCGCQADGRSSRRCTNPHCREGWRVNRCGVCKAPVDSRDPETPRCHKCGWLICANCDACNCPR